MKIMRVLLIVMLLFALCGQAFPKGQRYVPTGAYNYLSVGQMGMGGMTTMIGTSAATTFNNPALLNRQKFDIEITPVIIGLGDDLTDIVNFVSDHKDDFAVFDSLSPAEQGAFINDSESFDNKWMGIHVSPFVGLAFKGWGVGGYGNVSTDVKLDQGVVVPSVGARGYMDVVVGIGHGRIVEIAGTEWELGATFRFIQRQTVSPIKVSAADAGDTGELSSTVMDELEDPTAGFGVDVGMIRTLELKGKELDVGVVVQDLIGSMDGMVKPNLKFGAMYHMPFADNMMLKRFDVGMEYVDFFNRAGTSV
ncbi:MAG: hypothetical protein RAP03_00050, partial [Candidatus Electryonea clarkiae]|nr:hypothetical protein [Candidatus Electryonea clarkiae]